MSGKGGEDFDDGVEVGAVIGGIVTEGRNDEKAREWGFVADFETDRCGGSAAIEGGAQFAGE